MNCGETARFKRFFNASLTAAISASGRRADAIDELLADSAALTVENENGDWFHDGFPFDFAFAVIIRPHMGITVVSAGTPAAR